jgi:RND family efflux transporter MFP subunit
MIKRIMIGAGLVAVGAVGASLVQQWRAPAHPVSATPTTVEAPGAVEPAGDRRLTLSNDALTRAGIVAVEVQQGAQDARRRLPAVVEPHGYRVVDVTTLVAGSVIDVRPQLGDLVRQGQVVARLRSPELTDEVRRWITIKAERDVVAQRLARTEGLAKIGAASRQDLEEDTASLVRVRTDLDTARLRLERLGVSESRLAAAEQGETLPEVFDVFAQAGGVVTQRAVNSGQNVMAGEVLMTVADRSRVWVIADVFEADLGHVREGQAARVRSEAFPAREWTGRVAYVDPSIARDTRTAKVRIEVENTGEVLRFGMFVSVDLGTTGALTGISVPKTAIQSIGAVHVVYVELAPGQYAERVVVPGVALGDSVEVTSGLSAGDRVVTSGSFALRAERDRLGWPAPAGIHGGALAPELGAATRPVLTRVVEITAAGLAPARVSVPANQPVDLVFIRRVSETCGTEVAIPHLNVRQDVPLDTRITIRLPPQPPGELSFSCGMDMLKGVIVVGR